MPKILNAILCTTLLLSTSQVAIAANQDVDNGSLPDINEAKKFLNVDELPSTLQFGQIEKECPEGAVCAEGFDTMATGSTDVRMNYYAPTVNHIYSAAKTTPESYFYTVTCLTQLNHYENGAWKTYSTGDKDTSLGSDAVSMANTYSSLAGSWQGLSQHSVAHGATLEIAYTADVLKY